METLQNKNCCIEYCESEKGIFGRDLTDENNDPAFYSKSKRGIKKAWEVLTKDFTHDSNMYWVQRFLNEHKIKTHYWCMMD